MKDELRFRIQGSSGPLEAKNRTREYLQARILSSLQRAGAMVPLAFQGGTALRFLYSIRGADWHRIAADVGPFLEVPDEVNLLTEDTVVQVLGR